jgi:hypothetical protein
MYIPVFVCLILVGCKGTDSAPVQSVAPPAVKTAAEGEGQAANEAKADALLAEMGITKYAGSRVESDASDETAGGTRTVSLKLAAGDPVETVAVFYTGQGFAPMQTSPLFLGELSETSTGFRVSIAIENSGGGTTISFTGTKKIETQ